MIKHYCPSCGASFNGPNFCYECKVETAPLIEPAEEATDWLTRPEDTQVGGDHYRSMKVQPWAALASWLTPEQYEGYLLGVVIDYLCRYNATGKGKGGLMDLKKGRHTLDKLISVLEDAENV